ncbi:VRR-NUC domain-containing protein [Pseudomonas matsuisoli]|uniref:phosphodiesterase I n=1 Tax=Pseudomonas matsuisoli TaxID=1515666 RepID=A0A917PMW5_9PSED|nr:VRR-NUC domain-containing protein [Pseudomonas matsuisoli]GGJ84923.1 Fanconi-associated nuclease [Pseudomonas matsuisoli]
MSKPNLQAVSPASVDHPFYYLLNFQSVLAWVHERHGDLLLDDERRQIEAFGGLPETAQALLVRMIMRKGETFRCAKLHYPEIGDCRAAMACLAQEGWVEQGFAIDVTALFALCTRHELAAIFGSSRGLRKEEWLQSILETEPEPRPFEGWHADDELFRLSCRPLCERLRLMFFGNLRQTWSDFVLADLGIYRYEQIALDAGSRGFRTRDDIDAYLRIQACRDRFDAGEPVEALLDALPATSDCVWLDSRRARLLFLMGQQCERTGELPLAEVLYKDCSHVGARSRWLRVLERLERYGEALTLAEEMMQTPRDEAEVQHLHRIVPRLKRKLGYPQARKAVPLQYERLDLSLDPLGLSVEQCVSLHLSQIEAPVFYVENQLINALFGLLCWDAIFAPVPGAFFHPFHAGPVDLYDPAFRSRRSALFQMCFATLGDGTYRDRILNCYRLKQGILSPFVHWGGVDEALLELALDCMPAAHLRHWFERLLRDVKANRTGMPDLVQFWPQERRYRMIEVKGPGDRLQDNQLRWLAFCAEHEMPVTVCYVQWREAIA